MLPFAALRFPETKGLSLEEIGALFDDEIVLDISHLTEEQKQALDARIAANADTSDIARISLSKDASSEKNDYVEDMERQS